MVGCIMFGIVIGGGILGINKFKNKGALHREDERISIKKILLGGVNILEAYKFYKPFLEESINEGFNKEKLTYDDDYYLKINIKFDILKKYYENQLISTYVEEYRENRSLYSSYERKVIDLIYFNTSMMCQLLEISIEIYENRMKLSEEYKDEIRFKINKLGKGIENLEGILYKNGYRYFTLNSCYK